MSDQSLNSCKLPLIAVTVHPSKYNGTQDPESWLQDIRFFCRLHGIDEEEEIVSFAILKVDPIIFIPEKTSTFSAFLRALKNHVTYTVMSQAALHNLRRLKYSSNVDMSDFISTFLSLCRSANVTNLEEQKSFLLGSLHDDNIRNILSSKFRPVDEFDWVIRIFQGIIYEYPLHQIRCGSKITIKHCITGQYLSHGEHKPIAPGSPHSTVFCNGSRPRENEIWIVTSPFGENKNSGDPVHFNSIIGLSHEKSRSNLCAANELASRDVWASTGKDSNCNWIVRRHATESGYLNENNGVWAIGDIIILEHVNNKLPLFTQSHVEFIDSHSNSNQEVLLDGDGFEENNKWYAEIVGQ